LNTVVTGTFLTLVAAIVLLSVREWMLLLTKRKPARLSETSAVWLPDYALGEPKSANLAGVAALTIALAKELSGEARIERAEAHMAVCLHHSESQPIPAGSESDTPEHRKQAIYVETTEQRFTGINRCC
jgi:carbon starvation protein